MLDVSRDMFGCEYQKQGGIYTVYARQMRTQVFQINNIDVGSPRQTDTQVNIGSTASSAPQITHRAIHRLIQVAVNLRAKSLLAAKIILALGYKPNTKAILG